MKILFVASLHHPQQLIDAIASTPPGEPVPLFPPSMGQYHFEQAMRRRGHELAVFYRNLPGLVSVDIASLRQQKHTQGITPGKVVNALANRLPPHLNPDKRARNTRLLEQAKQFRPDVMWLVGDNTVIYSETLREIKQETGCLIAYASGTSPIVFSHKIERDAARLYDVVLVNDFYHGMQWRELGAKYAEALPIAAVSPEFHRPYDLTDDERAAYACDVAFVGTLVPDSLYSRRVQALEALRDFDMGVWSVHEVPASLQKHYRGSALGETMMRIMSAAKLTVNIHGDFMLYGGNMRMFEAAGVGVCQVIEAVPAAERWFTPGENILTYSTLDELRETVAALLQDDAKRAQIAHSAREHVYAHHTYDHRVERFEQLISERQHERQ
ncbi:MAG: glycosyltransferase [Chloroflexota bacterium]